MHDRQKELSKLWKLNGYLWMFSYEHYVTLSFDRKKNTCNELSYIVFLFLVKIPA